MGLENHDSSKISTITKKLPKIYIQFSNLPKIYPKIQFQYQLHREAGFLVNLKTGCKFLVIFCKFLPNHGSLGPIYLNYTLEEQPPLCALGFPWRTRQVWVWTGPVRHGIPVAKLPGSGPSCVPWGSHVKLPHQGGFQAFGLNRREFSKDSWNIRGG